MDEFVALSEERLDEIRIAHASAIFGGHPKHRRGALTNALLQAAREASENTKRWLMEKVCDFCGAGEKSVCLKPHPQNEVCQMGDEITRAEHLSRTEGR